MDKHAKHNKPEGDNGPRNCSEHQFLKDVILIIVGLTTTFMFISSACSSHSVNLISSTKPININNPLTTTSTSSTTMTSVPSVTSRSEYEPEEVEGEDPEDVPLYPGSILIAFMVPNEEWPPEVQNLYVVPAKLDTVMEFLLEGLAQEGWELKIGQQTKDGFIATKDDDLLIAVKGYESERYPGYESEITIDWTPEWRRW